MAYSATTVLPDPVGAATTTLEPASRASKDACWNGSGSKPRLWANAARTAATGTDSAITALVVPQRPSLLEDAAHDDGQLVEHIQRHRHRHERIGVVAGRGDDGEEGDADDGRAANLPQLLAGDQPDHFEEHKDDGEEQNHAEDGARRHLKADVLRGAEQCGDAAAADADQPVQRLGPHQDRNEDA